MKPWLVGSETSERFPLWTRGNIGEVFPDPVAPLTYSLFMREEVEGGFRDAYVRMGAFAHDEFAEGKMETLGVFGSYGYLNASVIRIVGERAPGLSAQIMDDLFFGAQPGIPPYEEAPGDVNEERSAAIGKTFEWVMTTDSIDFAEEGEKLANQRRTERPNFDAMSNEDLWAYGRKLFKNDLRQLFSDHIFVTFVGPVPVGAVQQICEAVGRPEATLGIISGLGDVESAAPSMAMWKMGRVVAQDQALMTAFDAGVVGVLERLANAGEAGKKFLSEFEQFTYDYGSRGPNEWETRYQTWETKPQLALAAIDRMRLASNEADPALRNQAMAAERERLVAEIAPMLEGDPETQGTFLAAANAVRVFQAGRERTKTNNVKVIQEIRMALHTIGRRMVEKGFCDDEGDYALLNADEFDDWLKNPASFTDTLRERVELFDQYTALQEPFVFWQTQPEVSTWERRDSVKVEPVAVGDVLEGFPGCPGTATGTARVILDPIDPTALEPGDILVAPITDPSWTPLFVSAGGVIVDVGAAQSHAMIVSRELGIACVPSVTNATRRIPDGATVEVNGDAGTVTILALP